MEPVPGWNGFLYRKEVRAANPLCVKLNKDHRRSKDSNVFKLRICWNDDQKVRLIQERSLRFITTAMDYVVRHTKEEDRTNDRIKRASGSD